MSYNSDLQANNEELQAILNTVNALPNADSGGNVDLGVTGAKVGQTVKISAVDENGVPTAWESVDFPSGGASEKIWRKLKTITIAEDAAFVDITEDDDGNPFELEEFAFYIYTLKTGTAAACVFELYHEGNKFFSQGIGDVLQKTNTQMHTRGHAYHDGIGYCIDKTNHYTGASGNFAKNPTIPNETEEQSITKIRMRSSHSNAVFVAGSTIELWGVDA